MRRRRIQIVLALTIILGAVLIGCAQKDETAMKEVRQDEYPVTADSATFDEKRDNNFQDYISFDMDKGEIESLLDILRTSEMKIENVDDTDGNLYYYVNFYNEKGEKLLTVSKGEGDTAFVRKRDDDSTYRITCKEVSDYINKLAEEHKNDIKSHKKVVG